MSRRAVYHSERVYGDFSYLSLYTVYTSVSATGIVMTVTVTNTGASPETITGRDALVARTMTLWVRTTGMFALPHELHTRPWQQQLLTMRYGSKCGTPQC